MGLSVGTEGDFGDAIYLCGILKYLPGGPHTMLIQPSTVTKIKSIGAAKFCSRIKELFERQPYIKECRPWERGDTIEWASGNFRGAGMHQRVQTLMASHADHLLSVTNINVRPPHDDPWLEVEPSPITRGMVVVNRTSRYQNPNFPWQQITDHYRPKMVFLGSLSEYREFCNSFGNVSYIETRDFMEVARLIAGSELFIGNQSSCNAVCEGLKHRSILEVSSEIPDCIYNRPNAQWVDVGHVELPAIGEIPSLLIRPKMFDAPSVTTHTTPPGQWQVEGLPPFGVFDDLVKVCRLNNIGPENGDLVEWIKAQNALRAPDFFFGEDLYSVTRNPESARRNAGLPARTMKEMLGLP